MEFRDQRRRVGSRRVAERDDASQLHRSRRTHREGQHAEALRLEFVRRRGRIGRGLRETGDGGKGPLHHAQRGAARIGHSRLGHLGGGIERYELVQFRLIGRGAVRGGSANGTIDGILSAVRARQRRHSHHVRFVEAGQGADAGHLQFVVRQRARLVRAQDIHGRRFIHRGQPRRQHPELGQRLRPDRRRKGKGSR